ncbi:hypothetical protein Pfo_016508 [Paulownia fortunei]|nr:hypothetical protein Pfo_016508 [Paulownia fortunei]
MGVESNWLLWSSIIFEPINSATKEIWGVHSNTTLTKGASLSKSDRDDNKVIEISSDHTADDGDDDDTNYMHDIVGYEISEDNTDNSFWIEIAWYASVSTSDASLVEVDPVLVMSSTVEKKIELRKVDDQVEKSRRSPSAELPNNSTTSNSPWKNQWLSCTINISILPA